MQTLENTITVPSILNAHTALSIVWSLKKYITSETNFAIY